MLSVGGAALDVGVEAPASADARFCLDAYFRELSQRFDDGFDPGKSISARDEEMTPPAGYFVVARLDGCPVGCGALKCGDEAIGEIKRMWTAPGMRGRGVARRVLQTLESIARELGVATLRLETNRTLIEAQALYRQQGYTEVPAFNAESEPEEWGVILQTLSRELQAHPGVWTKIADGIRQSELLAGKSGDEAAAADFSATFELAEGA